MRIGLVVWSLYTVRGGIERLGAMIAEAMVRRGHEVVIFCQDIPPDGKPQYPIPSSVECISLNLGAQASVDKARRKIVASNLDVICDFFQDALLWLRHHEPYRHTARYIRT
jgi:nucleoside-diphosphate-sugar epimerase